MKMLLAAGALAAGLLAFGVSDASARCVCYPAYAHYAAPYYGGWHGGWHRGWGYGRRDWGRPGYGVGGWRGYGARGLYGTRGYHYGWRGAGRGVGWGWGRRGFGW